MNTAPIHEIYLAGIVALSLVLPLMASVLAPRNATGPKFWLGTVWVGQTFLAAGALMVVLAPLHPAYGLGAGIASCAIFGSVVYAQPRQVQSRRS